MADASLKSLLRRTETTWSIGVINGPNLSNLGTFAPKRFGPVPGLRDIQSLEAFVRELGSSLGIEVLWFVSNHEGEILEWVHAAPERVHGLIINPGGLTLFGAATRQALADTDLPVVECHLANLAKRGRDSLFTPTVLGQIHGFRQHSYAASLVALVGILDERSQ